jgi:branched-chain amino acid transport system permease protein
MGYFYTLVSRIWETSLTAIGGHLTLSLGGILFLGFPAAFWFGAYGYAIAAKAGVSLLVSLGVGIALSAALGVLFAFFYPRMSNDSFAVITLASVMACDALIRSWDSLTGGVLGIAGVPRLSIASTLGSLAVLETIVIILAFIFEAFLIQSPFGRSLRALKENKNALTALGTSSKNIGQSTVFLASILAGITGIFAAMRVQFLDPSLGGIFLLVQTLTIVIIANKPKTLRLLGITVAIVLLPEALRFLNLPTSILGYMRNLVYASMLIILIYYVAYNTSPKRNV